MTKTATKDLAPTRKTLPELLNQVDTREMFTRMLGKDADGFMQNMMTVYNSSLKDAGCDPDSIVAACAISASLGLSILPGLGQSCVVPYKDGDKIVAQWQIMVRGVIQLAHRSGQYKRVNASRVYEGQLVKHDEHKGIVELREARKSDRVMGYYFWFELNTGTVMEFYWSAKKCIEHGLRYSKSFQKGLGKWAEDPEFVKAGSVKKWLDGKEHFLTEGSGADAMSAKTSVKNPLLKWGPLDTKIKTNVNLDQAVFGSDRQAKFVDNPIETTAETTGPGKEYAPPPMAQPGMKPPAGERIAWTRADAAKKGVPVDQFDTWAAKIKGSAEEVAEAVESEWRKLAHAVANGEKYAAFEVPEQKKDEGAEKTVAFKVYSVVESEFEGEPAFCIRDMNEPPVKRFTTDSAVIAAANAAKKSGEELKAHAVDKKSGKNTFDWLTRLA